MQENYGYIKKNEIFFQIIKDENNSFDAVILAAGKGSRYKSLKPKQYTKINNKNLIDIAVEKILKMKEINNIFIVVDNKKSYSIPSESANLLINRAVPEQNLFIMLYNSCPLLKNLSKNVLIHDHEI